MKSRMSAAVCLVSILAVAFAYGQSSSVLGRVNVPHKFMANDKEMPAGKYEFVRSGADPYRLVLRNRDTGASMYLKVVERLAQTGSSDAPGRVVFNSVGDRLFLSEFWPSGNQEGYLVQVTKKEHKHETLKAE